MSRLYGPIHRSLQDRFDTRRLADNVETRVVLTEIPPEHKAFIESRDMFFLSTIDHQGRPTVSYKGGDPGFVRVLDSKTIAFPCYDGNGMYLSMGNVAANGHVGLLFIDLASPKRLRVNGTARIEPAESVTPRFADAQFVVVVAIREVFPNCPRYIHKYTLVERSQFVPREGTTPPNPKWKQMDWARDVLPHNDPATQDQLPRSGS